MRWGRYPGEHIPGARYVELLGADHLVMAGDEGELLDEVEQFLTGSRRDREPDRVPATVVFGDIVQSTERAADLGDARWRDLLAAHDSRVRAELDRYRGRLVKTMGDGFLATFDGPARAIRFGAAIRDGIRDMGLELRWASTPARSRRATATSAASRCTSASAWPPRPGEVLASGTVKDLVVARDSLQRPRVAAPEGRPGGMAALRGRGMKRMRGYSPSPWSSSSCWFSWS